MATETPSDAKVAQLKTGESGGQQDAVKNGVRLASEFFVPGGSQFLDGKVGSGAVHAVAGLVAKALIGPPGWILAAANSYSKSCSDKNLLELFQRPGAAKKED